MLKAELEQARWTELNSFTLHLADRIVLTIITTKVTIISPDGKDILARIIMIQRFFFYGIKTDSNGFPVIKSKKLTVDIFTGTANTCRFRGYLAIMRTEKAFNLLIVLSEIITCLMHS